MRISITTFLLVAVVAGQARAQVAPPTGSKTEPGKSESTQEHARIAQAPAEVLQAYATGGGEYAQASGKPISAAIPQTVHAAVPVRPRVAVASPPFGASYATFPPQDVYRPLPYSQLPTMIRNPSDGYPVVGYATVGATYAAQAPPRLNLGHPRYGYEAAAPGYVTVAPATVYAEPSIHDNGYRVHDVGYAAVGPVLRVRNPETPVYTSLVPRKHPSPYSVRYTMMGVPAFQVPPTDGYFGDQDFYHPYHLHHHHHHQPPQNNYIQKASSTPVYSSVYAGPAVRPRLYETPYQ